MSYIVEFRGAAVTIDDQRLEEEFGGYLNAAVSASVAEIVGEEVTVARVCDANRIGAAYWKLTVADAVSGEVLGRADLTHG